MDSAQFGVILRLLIAAALCGVVGLERQLREKPAGPQAGLWAGLRAHMLTALAAALFMTLGGAALRCYDAALPGAPLAADPTRVFSAIIVGVSLITAGAVLRGREAWPMRSLATGVSLLITAGVGSAVGLEQYIIAGGAALLALVVNLAAGWLERRAPHDDHPVEEIGEEEEPLREL